jgi:hypothetical protein
MRVDAFAAMQQNGCMLTISGLSEAHHVFEGRVTPALLGATKALTAPWPKA